LDTNLSQFGCDFAGALVMRFGLLLLALASATPLSAEPGVKMFGGWIAGCSNENICTAIRPLWDAIDALPANPGTPFVQIRHHPHRDAAPEITLFDTRNLTPDAVLKTLSVIMVIEFEKDEANCKCKSDCPRNIRFYNAHAHGKGGYRFNDEDARSVLHGLRHGKEVLVTIGDKHGFPLNTAHLDEALALFDREQDLDNTPGALVLRPGNIMYDYAHPWPPDADTVKLYPFTNTHFIGWLESYLKQHPGAKVKHRQEAGRGLITVVRYKSFEFDCGVFERWAYSGIGHEFVLVERREMPVCSGVPEEHWINTYRADTISPEAP
jgi:hypothetical protein